jgi:hypothetical protein
MVEAVVPVLIENTGTVVVDVVAVLLAIEMV